MMKNILQSPNRSNPLDPAPTFVRSNFDSAIWDKGYDVTIEKALRCPCCGNLNSALFDCENCFGTGYFYINPTNTKVLGTAINQSNQYKSWSQELMGTIAVTVTDDDKALLGFFNRITLKREYSYFSEILDIRKISGEYFVFTTYRPIDIISIHLFENSAKKLIRLSDFEIKDDNSYCVKLDLPDLDIDWRVISIYYKHEPEYHVLDLPHEIRSSWDRNKRSGSTEKIQLPIQAIARRSHLIAMEKPNYDGSGVVINDNI